MDFANCVQDHVKDFLAKCCDDEKNDPNQWTSNYFTPARHDRNAIAGECRTPIDLSPDSFEGVSLSDMKSVVLNLKDHPDAKHLDHAVFAILDDQGIKDHTVVIHYRHVPALDPDMAPDDPRQQEEAPELDADMKPKWLSWRVRWKHAYVMTANLSWGENMIYEVYTSHPERFTDEDGVYDVDAAVHGG